MGSRIARRGGRHADVRHPFKYLQHEHYLMACDGCGKALVMSGIKRHDAVCAGLADGGLTLSGRSICRPTPIDNHGRSGHQGRCIGGQEHDRSHQLLNLTYPAEFDTAHDPATSCFIRKKTTSQRRLNEGRADRVDANSDRKSVV